MKPKMKLLFIIFILIHSLPLKALALSIIIDEEVESVILTLATPIFKAANLDSLNLKVNIIQNKNINAFVVDNHSIFIHSGLLTYSDNPSTLVGIIAHECGHIALGHISKRGQLMEEAKQKMIATFLLGAAAGILGKSSELAVGTITGGMHATEMQVLTHSRNQETEADLAALRFLKKANISPQGLLDVLKFFASNERAFYRDISPYVLTHPVSKERINIINNHSSKHSETDFSENTRHNFAMISAKIFAFTNPPQTTLTKFKGNNKEDVYAKSIAAYRMGNLKNAIDLINGLIKEEPNSPYLNEMKAQMLYENGKLSQALEYYRKALSLKPRSNNFKIEVAAALMSIGGEEKINEAKNLLRQVVEVDSTNYAAWRTYGIALGKSLESVHSQIALAKAYSIAGDDKSVLKFSNTIKQKIKTAPLNDNFWKEQYNSLLKSEST